MKKVEKYIKLYKEDKITSLQAKKQLKARLYKEWYQKLYKEAENN